MLLHSSNVLLLLLLATRTSFAESGGKILCKGQSYLNRINQEGSSEDSWVC